MKNKIILSLAIISLLVLSGCYTNTIDSLSTFKFQIPIFFYSHWVNKAAPDTTYDYVNLDDYAEYRDNKEKIKKAEIISFNYWIDSLMVDQGVPFDPEKSEDIEFEFIRFYIQFEGETNKHLIGEFLNVSAKEYYRKPQHILEVPSTVAEIIAVALKEKPKFNILSIYSKTKGQTEEKKYIPLVNARFDLFIRFEVEL